jgi:hypothetical protein
LQFALDSALRRGSTTVAQILTRLDELGSRGRPGTEALRRMVAEAHGEIAPHSPLERRFLALLADDGYPAPVRQFEVEIGWTRTIHIDFAYPHLRIGIETDGYEPHDSRAQWQLDRRRDAELGVRGWLILRFTHSDVTRRPEYVVAKLTEARALRTQAFS